MDKKLKKLLLCSALTLAGTALSATDNGDGTYTNPIIHADYPDSEIIRAGNDYYYLSSSFHFIPSNPIMHSKDLVNWRPVGYTIPNYDAMNDPRYDLKDGKSAYGLGSWAPSLRYHDGMFYSICYVWLKTGNINRPDTVKGHLLVSRSKSIRGPWKINVIDKHLYDPGLLFDDDGRVYVFHGQNNIYVTELDKDLTKTISEPKLIYRGNAYLEGAHAYKINGMYYLYCPGGGNQHALRSKNIYGPYEHKTVCMSDLNFPGSGLHQGGLVDTPSGQWWAVIFQDRGKHGRIPFLLPVTWEDGWPITHPVMTYEKPDVSSKGAKSKPADPDWMSDDFNKPKLGVQWQWNHNPDPDGWSLTERPGFLRLRTTTKADALRKAKNTLAQRIFGPDSGAAAKLDVSGLKDGDYAGLGLLCQYSTFVAVVGKDGKKVVQLVYQPNKGGFNFETRVLKEIPLEGDVVRFKATIDSLEYAVQYWYAENGKKFQPIGDKVPMPYEFFLDWLGPRYCLFFYSTEKTGGHVDFDWFRYIMPKHSTNLRTVGETLDAQFCDEWDDMNGTRFVWVDDEYPNVALKFKTRCVFSGRFEELTSWACAFRANRANQWLKFNRIDFGRNGAEEVVVKAKGRGEIQVRLNDSEGETIASGRIDSNEMEETTLPVAKKLDGVRPVVFVFVPDSGQTIEMRSARFAAKEKTKRKR